MKGTAVDNMRNAEPEPKPISLPRTLRQRDTSQNQDISPPQTQQLQSRKERTQGTSTTARSPSDAESESSVITRPSRNALGKRPSVVQEQREPRESMDKPEKVLGHQAAMRHVEPEIKQELAPENLAKETQQPALFRPPQPAVTLPAPHGHPTGEPQLPTTDQPLKPGSNLAKLVVERQMREASTSPTRKTQFLSPTDAAGVRHEPPSRSISPRKSALKHSTSSASPRGMSPIGDRLMTGEVSDASTIQSDDKLGAAGPGVVRKKSVRVSFDEGSNVVVPEPEEIVPARRIWSGGSYRNRSNSPLAEEEVTYMGPRPLLPVFGSVRKREFSRESEDKERPLVKPHEPRDTAQSTPLGHTPGSSTDHAVGAIISQDIAAKQPLPPSPAPAPSDPDQIVTSSEPLPPLVTSVEGSGYNTTPSDSDSSEDLDRLSVHIEEATAVPIPLAEREALRTPDSIGRARFIEHIESETGSGHSTPTHDSPRVSKPQEPSEDKTVCSPIAEEASTKSTSQKESSPEDATQSERQKSESLPFTPPEDEDIVTLAQKVAQAKLATGTAPSFVITVPTPEVKQTEWAPQVPGAWDTDVETPSPRTEDKEPTYSTEQQPEQQGEPRTAQQSIEADEVTPATLGIAEPEPLPHRPGSPVVGEIAEEAAYGPERTRRGSISAQSEDSSNESIYSDAAEQLTDHEGDGFQSLDAVVESPTAKIVPGFVAPVPTSPPRSPTKVKQNDEGLSGWERTQRYWMSLSDAKKRELEEEARRLAEEEMEESMEIQQSPIIRPSQPQQQVRPMQEVFEQPQELELERRVSPERQYQITPGTKAAANGAPASAPASAAASTMRGSMRQSKPAPQDQKTGIGMRQSLRGEPAPAQRNSNLAPARAAGSAISASRANANTRALTKAAKPAVSAETQAYAKALAVAQQRAAERKAAEQGGPPPGGLGLGQRQMGAQVQQPRLQRTNSAGSDSSFKRERSGGNGFFRSSQQRREEQAPSLRTRNASPPNGEKRRFSVRSLSPAGRQPHVESKSAAAHLTTLRGNAASRPSPVYETPPALQPKHKEKYSLFGRKKEKASPISAGPSSGGGFFANSRFADSDSDIDAPRPTTFKSRFADSSSDEEDPAPLPSFGGSMGSRSFRNSAPPAPRQPLRGSLRGNGGNAGNEDEEHDTDIEDEATKLNTLRNQQQGIEAQAAAKGVNPQAILLAQQYFGNGGVMPQVPIPAPYTQPQPTPHRHSSFGPTTPTAAVPTQAPFSAPQPQRANTAGSLNPTTPNFRTTPPKKDKGGFMSILRRKRPDSATKVNKQTLSESGARKDTPLERNKADLEAVRRGDEQPQITMPKLRKKGAPMGQLEAGSRVSSFQPEAGSRVGSFQPDIGDSTMQIRPDVEEAIRRPSTSDGNNVEINGVREQLKEEAGQPKAESWQKPGMLRRNTASATREVEFKSGKKEKKKGGFFKRLFEH